MDSRRINQNRKISPGGDSPSVDGRADPPGVSTIYRVNWKSHIPYIESGKIVIRGQKGTLQKASFPSEKKCIPLHYGHKTIKEAIESEITHVAQLFCPSITIWGTREKPQEPWRLVISVCKILRLYRKLEKHNLIHD